MRLRGILGAVVGSALAAGFGIAIEEPRPSIRVRHPRERQRTPAIDEIYSGHGARLLPPAPHKPLSKRAKRRARGRTKAAR